MSTRCPRPLPIGSSSIRLRKSILAAALLGIIAILASGGTARAQKPKAVYHSDIVLTTARPDAVEIHISYFQSDVGKQAPVVVMLHPEGSNRQVWGNDRVGFAKRLWDQGYAVIAVDLRKHGQSVIQGPAVRNEITPGDRQEMVRFDMEAVKDFIFKEHMAERLNMNKTGIIAAETTTAVAVHYTIADWAKRPYDDGVGTPRGQDIRALILMSPEKNPKGLSMGSRLTDLGKLAAIELPALEFSVLFLYGEADKKDKRRETLGMYNTASRIRGAKERVLIQSYPYKFRGVELIGQNNARTKCEEHMLFFLEKHLKELTQTPWRDRRSVFDRN